MFQLFQRPTCPLLRDSSESWNEWGEGNYMEPDLRFGKQYIEACRQTINAFDWTMDGTL